MPVVDRSPWIVVALVAPPNAGTAGHGGFAADEYEISGEAQGNSVGMPRLDPGGCRER